MNKGFHRPELIELIEQEGWRVFLPVDKSEKSRICIEMKISKFQYSFFWTTNAQLEKSPLKQPQGFSGKRACPRI